jgi:2-polyprenyl-3-methyl-5-hydroxy-6-metoxy-1,4-benzoquinol methylase
MNLLEITHCNVCAGGDIFPFMHLPAVPLVLRPLNAIAKQRLRHNKDFSATIPLEMGICKDCGHMMILKRPADEILHMIYTDLYETYPSSLGLGIATSDADHFIEDFRRYVQHSLRVGARIMEIGCYDGYVLSRLAEDGFDVQGCDPSDGAEIGQKRGIPITRRFYSPALFPSRHFAAVINRHIIEHLLCPVDFAQSIKDVLVKSGNLIVETPNGGYHLKHGSMDPFHFEHISVFTRPSMIRCLQEAGFAASRMLSDTRNLIAICKSDAKIRHMEIEKSEIEDVIASAEMYNIRLGAFLSELNGVFEDARTKGKTIAIWGAGSMGITILSLLDRISDQVTVVVDRDHRKHGLSFLNVDVSVKPPEFLVKRPADIIVICSQYTDEIMRDIRENFGGLTSTIVLLTPKLKIIP